MSYPEVVLTIMKNLRPQKGKWFMMYTGQYVMFHAKSVQKKSHSLVGVIKETA